MKRFFYFMPRAAIFLATIASFILIQKSGLSFTKKPTINISSIFPSTPEEIFLQADNSIKEARQILQDIITTPLPEKTFTNTIKKLDELIALSNLSLKSTAIHVLEIVSPNESIRAAAHEAIMRMQEFMIDEIANNFTLYTSIKWYYENKAPLEKLSEKEKFYLEETMLSFKHKGFDLPEEKRHQVSILEKEIARLCLDFDANIAADQTTIFVTKDGLSGVSEDFINSLKETESGYLIVVNAPNHTKIMAECSISETRERLYKAYINRAYPANDILLKQIIAKRNELANVLGFDSYASYDLENQMVKTPQRAQQFLDDLNEQVKSKTEEELLLLTQSLDSSIKQSPEGKFYPWDRSFIENQYKKKYLQIDEEKIAEYFPIDTTLKNLLSIYESFFSLDLPLKKTKNLWHEEVLIVEVYPKGENQLIGCILLDLFPRPFKFSHACDINLIPATYQNGIKNIALSLVITNFPPSIDGKPPLLQRLHVKTLFHEFGHALHDMLGRTPFGSMSGTNVKMDFVEMPSQMLEEWLSDKEILKKMSCHYQTKEPIPDNLIDTIIASKNTFSGLLVAQQVYFAKLSLDLFAPGSDKDPYTICKTLATTIKPQFVFSPEDHMYASFGHLSGYGAKYYGYMWSKVFALDIFSLIKEKGLLNANIGKRYAEEVLGQGASVDPNILLEKFLGREPNNKAFLQDLGI
jgi:thimet oligopeptidase